MNHCFLREPFIRGAVLMTVLLGAVGCVVPRSLTVGQTARAIGTGATEVGVFGGVLYASQTNPPTASTTASGEPQNSQVRGQTFGLPSAEANVQHGLSDRFTLNVHASPAGIQPGLKWTLNKSNLAHVALLPAAAIGYGSYGENTLVSGADGVQAPTSPASISSFTFLAGLKFLVSHQNGFYGAIGYDFSVNRSLRKGMLGVGNVQDPTETISVSTGHQIGLALGLDIPLGMVHLRPEMAFAAFPGLTVARTVRVAPTENTSASGGGFGFAVLGGFTVAVASPKRAPEVDKRNGNDDRDVDDGSTRFDDEEEGENEIRPQKRDRPRSLPEADEWEE